MRVCPIKIWLLFVSVLAYAAPEHEPPKKPAFFHTFDDTLLAPCSAKKCFSLDEVIEASRDRSFETRLALNKLYQYHQYVKVKVGRLLPSLSFTHTLGAVLLDPAILFSVGGFIFPSNWFRWKESKLLYLAEKYSFINLLANQVRLGEVIYFNLHRELYASYIYKHYFTIVDLILQHMRNAEEDGRLNRGDVAIIEALRADMSATALFIQDTIEDLIPRLGLELAMPLDEAWDTYGIHHVQLPNIQDEEFWVPEEFMGKAREQADHLHSLYFLSKAANMALKSRYFEWMTPFSGPDEFLGFGLGAQINITKAQGKAILIEHEKAENQLKYQVYSAVGVRNTAIKGFRESMDGRVAITKLMDYLVEQINGKKKIDIHQLYEGIFLSVEFDILRNFAQHLFWITESSVRRLLKEGPHYKDLSLGVPAPKRFKRLSLKHINKRRENRQFKKMLKKGKIKLNSQDKKLFRKK